MLVKPKLFSGRSDRLAARLKSMLFAWRFIDQMDGELFVIWPKLPSRYAEEDVDYSPTQIFDLPKYYASNSKHNLYFLECNSPPPDDAIKLDGEEFAKAARDGFVRAEFLQRGRVFSQAGSPQFRFSDEPADDDYMIEGTRRLFNQLPVNSQILRARDAFYARYKLAPGEFDVLHLRRGDVFDMLRTELPLGINGALKQSRLEVLVGHFIARTAPAEFYREALSNRLPGAQIVFASDSPESISEIAAKYRNIRFVDLSKAKLPVPIQKAFLDFLVIKDAAQIIGTSSNFTQLPADLGSAKVVNVAGVGSIDVVESEFRDNFLANGRVDPVTGAEAVRLLREGYDRFQARRAASVRARNSSPTTDFPFSRQPSGGARALIDEPVIGRHPQPITPAQAPLTNVEPAQRQKRRRETRR